MEDVLIQLAIFLGFLVLQALFAHIERVLEGRRFRSHILVWLLHPTVVHTVHDMGVYFVSELHSFVVFAH